MKSLNLGFVKFADIPKYYERLSEKITVSLSPDDETLESAVTGRNIEVVNSNTIRLFNTEKERATDNSVPYLRVRDKTNTDIGNYWGKTLSANEIIIRKKSSDKFNIVNEHGSLIVSVEAVQK